ncbi:MAG: hypothetical protein WCL50_01315 [Spirochaetota bacterium]
MLVSAKRNEVDGPVLHFMLCLALVVATLLASCANPVQADTKINNPFSGKFLTNTGAPASSLGANGDLYLDTASTTLYVKRNGAWGNIVALKGQDGANGATWLSGSGAPSSTMGADGDFYLDTSASKVYRRSSGSWTVALTLSQPGGAWLSGSGAPASALGTDGAFYLDSQGGAIYQKASGSWGSVINLKATGGSTWLTGNSAPGAFLGSNGDLYLDTVTTIAYQKVGGAWQSLVTLRGPQGDAGTTGPTGGAGTNGNTWYTGTADPASSLGANGDLYLNTSSTAVFKKNSGTWASVVTLQGAQGAAGATGSAGISIVWKGTAAAAPASPQANWAYYDSVQKMSLIYDGSAWQTLAIDGATGEAGATGSAELSIVWKGSLATAPTTGLQANWAYYNTVDKKAYIYDGSAWQTLAIDGSTGTTGSAGLSIVWKGSLATAPTTGLQANWAYYNTADKKSYIYDGNAWQILAVDGATGAAGPGITWVDVTGTSQMAVSNTGYLADSASQVTITLPASPAVGDIVQVTGVGAGGWKIAQNAGQSVATKNLPQIGVSWTARASNLNWRSVSSSADGTKLVASANGQQIYTSTDSGVTWTARDSNRSWLSVASSADGTKLVACVWNGQIYTSTDSGVTWTARDSSRQWYSVASSADGSKLVACVQDGQIYTSTDSGVTWTARASSLIWFSVASSADGTKLVASVIPGGQIYTSTPTSMASTTTGTSGSISGGQYDSIDLQYIGNNTFTVISNEGYLVVQ